MIQFSVIIVTWNAAHYLKEYLPSVAATEYPDFEIIIADNGSEDDSIRWVERSYPDIKIADLKENFGYCGGNNRGATYANGEVLLFLNNDVTVEPDWLQKLSDTFERHPDTAILQPKLLDLKKPTHFEYAGAAGGYLDRHAYPFCRGRVFEHLERDEGQYDDEAEILWASGAALAIKRPLFEELNGFDEDFEFHMEEIDLCWRAWNRGYKARFCPESVVYHLGGGSLPTGHPRKVRYNFRNNLIMLWKNVSPSRLASTFLMRYLLDLVALIQALITMKVYDAQAIMQAHLQFWKMLPQTRRKRAELWNQSQSSQDQSAAPIAPFSLIWRYFVRGENSYRELTD